MKITTKRCPHCGCQYSSTINSPNAFYGSPFIKCRSCGKTFVDKDAIELAIREPRWVDLAKVEPGAVVSAIIGLIALIAAFIIYRGEDGMIIMLIAGVLFGGIGLFIGIDDYRSYDKRMEELREERKKSEIRLSNIKYAKALKEIGYNVPDKYLSPHNDFLTKQVSTTSEPRFKYCPDCGFELTDDTIFCGNCGKKIF